MRSCFSDNWVSCLGSHVVKHHSRIPSDMTMHFFGFKSYYNLNTALLDTFEEMFGPTVFICTE
jgi:hypothetical protein